MSDDSVFELIWLDDSKYNLLYKGKLIGEGRAPPELIVEYVKLMNWAYNEGKNEIR